MKQNKLLPAIIKSFLVMAVMFLIGYMGYHFPDVMIVVIAVAVFSAVFAYFYNKDTEEK